MKTLSLLLFFALFTLAGCSADDLAGPDAAGVDAPLAAHASDAARPAFAPESFSITGVWRASDRFGTITLFLDESAAPDLGTSDTSAGIDGKGVITNTQREPIAILVEGQLQRLTVELVLLDGDGGFLAKGQGRFSTDLTEFKVVFLYEDGRERLLEFSRL